MSIDEVIDALNAIKAKMGSGDGSLYIVTEEGTFEPLGFGIEKDADGMWLVTMEVIE